MKLTTWAVIFATFAAMPISAQQAGDRGQSTQSRHVVEPPRKVRSAIVPACDPLTKLGLVMDRLYGNPVDEILAAIEGVGQKPDLPAVDGDADPVWGELMDCANQTHSESERAEAWRVAAMWEGRRADWFAKQQREARPVHPDSCGNLDQLRARVKAVTDGEPSLAITHPMPDYDSTAEALWKCANDVVRLSKSNPDDRYWSTVTVLSLELWEARRARTFFEQAYLNTADYAKAQAEYDARQKGGAEKNEKIRTDQPAGEAASQCDQVITVAGLTPNGLALYIPPEGQRFMAKNAKDYPRMCLVEETNAASFARGVPHYLLVWAYSENAFAGFQPVQQVTTSPVSGSGTVTNFYGDRWNFTYSGSLTEIDTVEAPYVIQSRSLYLWAYDGKGNIVSRHSISTSSQAGGDASYTAGYNAGALISLLWNNPSRLIKGVLKDVQKASGH